jgi:phospholipid/cholesterol/gamma-HCH transport system permease protein
VVVVAMFRELGPVLTGLMLSGRVGASIAAEIGTMKVTEQLDALRALGVHPIDYLVVPRVIAIYISMPLLVLEAIAFGIVAAWIVGVQLLEIPAAPFWTNIVRYNTFNEILYALIKGAFFAAVIVLTACHHGLAARNGAAGVGRAPTEAVVGGSLGILMMNFILSVLLNALLTESQG